MKIDFDGYVMTAKIIITDGKRFVVLSEGGKHISLPGGKLDENEDFDQGLVREAGVEELPILTKELKEVFDMRVPEFFLIQADTGSNYITYRTQVYVMYTDAKVLELIRSSKVKETIQVYLDSVDDPKLASTYTMAQIGVWLVKHGKREKLWSKRRDALDPGTCANFVHNPLNVESGDGHIHQCLAKENASKRCGYNSVSDSKKCSFYKSP
jgi:ADP-ribose pyrophosphatase YjhB (NUDIX family)